MLEEISEKDLIQGTLIAMKIVNECLQVNQIRNACGISALFNVCVTYFESKGVSEEAIHEFGESFQRCGIEIGGRAYKKKVRE